MRTLEYGCRGEDVKSLQRRLNIMADGIFGKLTREAVKEFQMSHGLKADGVVGPKTSAALNLQSGSRHVDEIIIHCTATPEGEDYSVDHIRRMHLARGFSDIGYHYLIGLDGTIHMGRNESIAGAHCLGHNTRSIGVCYVGGCPPRAVSGWQNMAKDTRTQAQRQALVKLLKELRARYPHATIHSHNEFANKACPCFNAKHEYKDL